MTQEELDEQCARVDRHVKDLREHFSEVVILCSAEQEDGATTRVFRSRGNWFARTEMARNFIEGIKEAQPVRIVPEDDGG